MFNRFWNQTCWTKGRGTGACSKAIKIWSRYCLAKVHEDRLFLCEPYLHGDTGNTSSHPRANMYAVAALPWNVQKSGSVVSRNKGPEDSDLTRGKPEQTLAGWSSTSFPGISTWPGIHELTISLMPWGTKDVTVFLFAIKMVYPRVQRGKHCKGTWERACRKELAALTKQVVDFSKTVYCKSIEFDKKSRHCL